jgi:hypothetical protein
MGSKSFYDRIGSTLFNSLTAAQMLERTITIGNNVQRSKEDNTIVNFAVMVQAWEGNNYPLNGDAIIKVRRIGEDAMDWIHLTKESTLEAIAYVGGDEIIPRAFWLTEVDGEKHICELDRLYLLAVSQNSTESGELGHLIYFNKGKLRICLVEGDPNLDAIRLLIADIVKLKDDQPQLESGTEDKEESNG